MQLTSEILTVARRNVAGQSSSTDGYTSGGITGTESNIIDKFAFGTPANATDFGDLTVARMSLQAKAHRLMGIPLGDIQEQYSNVIDKFAFGTPANATDFGD
jgi:hypothetical protein